MTAITGIQNQELINKYIAQQKATTAEEAAASSTEKTELLGNYDTFLKILTAQIKNQDPTEPMDASEFTNQLVQYSAVEQQINTNKKLDIILENMNLNGVTSLLSYVGQYTEVAGDGKMVVQGGQAMMSYNLPANVSSVSIAVQDQNGKVVAMIDGPAETGLNRVAWDGKRTNGLTAPDGVYKYVLTAKSSDGAVQKIDDIRVIGQVTGIETDANGGVKLKIGDLYVDTKNVKSIFASVGVASEAETEGA